MLPINKNDMARVIVQALNNSPELPAKENKTVLRIQRQKKSVLFDSYSIAFRVLTGRDFSII